jgi:hypothetical protein
MIHGFADAKEDRLKPHHEAILSEMTNPILTGGDLNESWIDLEHELSFAF